MTGTVARHTHRVVGRHRRHPNLLVPYIAPTVSVVSAAACAGGAVATAQASDGPLVRESGALSALDHVESGRSTLGDRTAPSAQPTTDTATATHARAAEVRASRSGRRPIAERRAEAALDRSPLWRLTGEEAERAAAQAERERTEAARASRAAERERRAAAAQERLRVERAAVSQARTSRSDTTRSLPVVRPEPTAAQPEVTPTPTRQGDAPTQQTEAPRREAAPVAAPQAPTAVREIPEPAPVAPPAPVQQAPVAGTWAHPAPGLQRTSGFGWRWGRMHNGVDFAGPEGTPMRAAHAGTVLYAGWFHASGRRVVIGMPDGTQLVYAHLSGFAVATGQTVQAGQTIGYLGNTGRSTGPHLHFEVRVAGFVAVDPEPWLAARGLL